MAAKSPAKSVKKTKKPAKSKSSGTTPKRAPAKGAKSAKAAAPAKAKAAAKTATGSKGAADPMVGRAAPAFKIADESGKTRSLADYKGQHLVLFFYPRASTPGCTLEAQDFTRLAGAFAKANTALLGISADSSKAQTAFKTKYKLAMPLLADEAQAALRAYGAWGQKSMYGKTFEGIIRTTVLIGKDGKVAQVWRKVKVEDHADAVLKAAQALA